MTAFRALSVLAPAGHLIRSGRKTLEIRQWKPEFDLPIFDLLIIQNAKRLSSTGLSHDPDGTVVAMVNVLRVRKWEKEDMVASCSQTFEEGWLAWELQNIRKFDYPLSVPARRRIYQVDLDPSLLKEIKI